MKMPSPLKNAIILTSALASIGSALLIPAAAQAEPAARMPRAQLVDTGGKLFALLGLANYQKVADRLKAQSPDLIPIPFALDKTGALVPVIVFKPDGSLDTTGAQFAIIGINRYDANYAFQSDRPEDIAVNPTGVVQARKIPQHLVFELIINPAAIGKAFKLNPNDPTSAPDPKFNPGVDAANFSTLISNDIAFNLKGREIWQNPWRFGKAGDLKMSFRIPKQGDKDQEVKISARGVFYDKDGGLLADLRMGTKPVKRKNAKGQDISVTGVSDKFKNEVQYQDYYYHAVATSQVDSTLYPVNSQSEKITRPYDPSVDSYELGGETKEYFESVDFQPLLWNAYTNFSSRVYDNYIPNTVSE